MFIIQVGVKKPMANKIIKTMSVLLAFPISNFNVILSIMEFNFYFLKDGITTFGMALLPKPCPKALAWVLISDQDSE